ncbi:hypothetical protein FHS29_001265 [Saccharothrix tamanrassetensis]|uniref:DUF4349 domain-containing protein n=1 Tax=Saccharothrix tamanrassetensis TaxID=1051531 RepID=A0A841CF99_9PSEU|nr:DUF4349 domain-containing protein [Saccharothrix tamanrassetensis]MBB5954695.1 hypothetical protein [Saccharothrix tamanrassetensis]
MGRRAGFAIAALALLALAGCSSSDGGGDSQAAVAPQAEQATPGRAGAQTKSPPGAQQENTAAESVAQNRQLIRTASVELRTPDVTTVLAKVKELAIAEGGFPAQENATKNHGTVTLRVPGDRLDAVLKSLTELSGVDVARREVRTEDVTEQVVDVEARLANQRASVERVRGLLERASTTSEITQIESELTKRQSELESLQRRYDSLKGQVAMSTLTVTVRSSGTTPGVPEEENFLTALAGGWDALVGAVAWLLVVIGAALPFALVLGTPLIGYLVWRRRRRAAVTP